MSDHVFETDCECKSCGGTGLYVGFAERGGAAVVCSTCDGTGKSHVRVEYTDFEGRKKRKGIKHVLQVNPGIGVAENGGYTFKDFGGMSYDEWDAGKPFPPGSEMRRFVCPAWWYQSADYKKKPDWPECIGCGTFSGCKHFASKGKCWTRWDKEHKGEAT